MKVNSKASQPLVSSRELGGLKDIGTKKAKADGEKISSAELAESTKLNLSPRAKQTAKAMDIAKNDSVDEAKIARLQKMIDGGEYKVDAEAISDRLVNEHLMIK
ncbi:MAG: flagellar biosynthesis anti-sigma factor FlgM [Bdellovibrionales bacterium]|nr:flagellar biosynthesis anti-sigma factor FlgM [Bdellovibrionales bacterium]